MSKPMARRISLNAALLASFSSLYMVILKMLPGIPAFGFPGVKIEIATALSPVYGLVLGHALAPSSIFLGTIMAMLLLPGKYSIFSYVSIFAAPLGSLASSLVFDRGSLLRVPKWLYSMAMYTALLVCWFATDVGRIAALFTAPYFATMLLVVFSSLMLKLSGGRAMLLIVLRVLAGCAAGIFADHLYGSLAAIIVFRYMLHSFEPSALAGVYLAAIPVALAERGFMILFSSIIAFNLYLALRKSRYLRVRVV